MNHQGRWSQKSDDNESCVLQDVLSDLRGDAFAGFKGVLKFGIEGSGDGLIFEQKISLENQTEGDDNFS